MNPRSIKPNQYLLVAIIVMASSQFAYSNAKPLPASITHSLNNTAHFAGSATNTPENVGKLAQQIAQIEQSIHKLDIPEKQVALYLIDQSTASMDARREKDAMGYMYVGHNLHISSEARFKAALELYGRGTKTAKSLASHLMAGLMRTNNDFSVLEVQLHLMHKNERKPPAELIQYMFRRDPSKALVTIIRAYISKPETQQSTRDALWAQHVISDNLWRQNWGFIPRTQVDPKAEKQLKVMAKQSNWWSREYAATIMRQHPEFRSPSLVNLLKDDQNMVVRKTIASFDHSSKGQ